MADRAFLAGHPRHVGRQCEHETHVWNNTFVFPQIFLNWRFTSSPKLSVLLLLLLMLVVVMVVVVVVVAVVVVVHREAQVFLWHLCFPKETIEIHFTEEEESGLNHLFSFFLNQGFLWTVGYCYLMNSFRENIHISIVWFYRRYIDHDDAMTWKQYLVLCEGIRPVTGWFCSNGQ